MASEPTGMENLAALYRSHRLLTQKDWYEARYQEFRKARNQARLGAASVLVLASGAAACSSADLGGGRQWWAVAAATLGAIATALTGYEATYGFDRLSRNYEQAVGAMAHLELTIDFDSAPGRTPSDAAKVIGRIEDELLREVDAWATQTSAAGVPEEEEDSTATDEPPP